MRTYKEEIELRTQQRERYFENPNYLKWSSIAQVDSVEYGGLSDDYLFQHYVMHLITTLLTQEDIDNSMNQSINQSIDLRAVYDYFDERLNDEDNMLKQELNFFHLCADDSLGKLTIKQILDKYRAMILELCYDMV